MNDFLNNLQIRFQNFMIDRNGLDNIGKYCIFAAAIIAVVNMFLGFPILMVVSYALIFYFAFRFFSKNTAKRRAEDEKATSLISSSRRRSEQKKEQFENRKTTVYFKCEECGQSLSVPRGKGTLKITCPKCHHQQTIKS